MKYRLTTQHNKSDSEQNVTITECKEDVKQKCFEDITGVMP